MKFTISKGLLMLLITADSIAKWGLVVAIITLLVSAVAAVAAIRAVVLAKAAPTKNDLARVETNTAQSSEHLQNLHSHMREQAEKDEAHSRAGRVAITVHGKDPGEQPLVVHLKLKDPSINLTRVDIYNEAQSPFGSFLCERIRELEYMFAIDPPTISNWYSGGRPIGAFNRALLTMRVYMRMDGHEVYRSMPVMLFNVQLNPTKEEPFLHGQGWIINGNI